MFNAVSLKDSNRQPLKTLVYHVVERFENRHTYPNYETTNHSTSTLSPSS